MLKVELEVIYINKIVQNIMNLINNKNIKLIQNVQSRVRSIILMTLSNQYKTVVLNTGNKSELSVGYNTIYGDSIGAYSILKDIYKTEVIKLSIFRNSLSYVIPIEIINRPPSAELLPNQKDIDDLPVYNILDKIIFLYIEKHFSLKNIVQLGFSKKIVYKIVKMINFSEYKRKQFPIGPKIHEIGFNKSRRYLITSKILI